jgi:hypothetical protein
MVSSLAYPKLLGTKRLGCCSCCGKGRGPGPRARGPRAVLAHGGPRSPSRGRLTGDRPERRPRARNLTAVEEKWRGDGGEPHWWHGRAAEGRTQLGDDGEQSVEGMLGGGGGVDSETRDCGRGECGDGRGVLLVLL